MAPTIVKDLAIAGSLVIGILEDLRTQKVRNNVVLSIFGFSIIIAISHYGFSELQTMALSIGFSFLLTLPLYLTGTLGAGDCKFLIAISPLLTWKDCLVLLAMALFWGALLGVFVSIFKGQFKDLMFNTFQVAFKISKGSQLKLHKIPFMVALFFGWLSMLTMKANGVLP